MASRHPIMIHRYPTRSIPSQLLSPDNRTGMRRMHTATSTHQLTSSKYFPKSPELSVPLLSFSSPKNSSFISNLNLPLSLSSPTTPSTTTHLSVSPTTNQVCPNCLYSSQTHSPAIFPPYHYEQNTMNYAHYIPSTYSTSRFHYDKDFPSIHTSSPSTPSRDTSSLHMPNKITPLQTLPLHGPSFSKRTSNDMDIPTITCDNETWIRYKTTMHTIVSLPHSTSLASTFKTSPILSAPSSSTSPSISTSINPFIDAEAKRQSQNIKQQQEIFMTTPSASPDTTPDSASSSSSPFSHASVPNSIIFPTSSISTNTSYVSTSHTSTNTSYVSTATSFSTSSPTISLSTDTESISMSSLSNSSSILSSPTSSEENSHITKQQEIFNNADSDSTPTKTKKKKKKKKKSSPSTNIVTLSDITPVSSISPSDFPLSSSTSILSIHSSINSSIDSEAKNNSQTTKLQHEIIITPSDSTEQITSSSPSLSSSSTHATILSPLLRYSTSDLYSIFKDNYKIQRQYKSFEEADGNISWTTYYIWSDTMEVFLKETGDLAVDVSSPFSFTSKTLSYYFKFNSTKSIDITTKLRSFIKNINSTYRQPFLKHTSTDIITCTPLLRYFAQLWEINPLPTLDDFLPSTFYIHHTMQAGKHESISYTGSLITFIPLHLLNLYCVHFFIDKLTYNIFALPIHDISYIPLPHNLTLLTCLPLAFYHYLHSPNIPRKDIIFSHFPS